MDYDLLIQGGRVLAPGGERDLDVAVADGQIVALGPALSGSATGEIDVAGLHVLPGAIDIHVHCDEPGRTGWEGFATATTALATGGMTAFVDMPLNSTPATVDADAFDRKVAAARMSSRVDFALWGGLVPGRLQELEPMHARGAIGFKAFMSETGMPDFRPADDATLLEGMRRVAALDGIVAVHAENNVLVTAAAERAIAEGRTDARAWLDSRPRVAELEAIGRAIAFSVESGCRLHIVHVSTAEGIALVQRAREDGVDVSWETATHFLALTEEDVIRQGTVAKCAPVMRDEANRVRLWDAVGTDARAIVASDHSPCPPALKDTEDFFAAWGGINGCQSTLGVLVHGVQAGRVKLPAAVAAVSANPAARLRLAGKGQVAVGFDADLTIVDLAAASTLGVEELRYRHPMSALVGCPMGGQVRHVLLRGQPLIDDGRVNGDIRGRLLRPSAAPAVAIAAAGR
jgi:allantoinase